MTRLTWLADTLRDEGCTVNEVSSWKTRGADRMYPSGVVWHHTATSSSWSDEQVCDLLRNGRSDLPGPLAHIGLARDGTCHLIAAGVANHAGSGGWHGLSGNAQVVGIEVFNDGKGEPWTDDQYQTAVTATAAILDHLGTDAQFLCGHKEWAPSRKIDPYGIDMTAARRDVHAVMTEEPEMTDEEVERVAEALFQKLTKGRDIAYDLKVIRESVRTLADHLGEDTAHEPPDKVTA